jgi:hypothetical protein
VVPDEVSSSDKVFPLQVMAPRGPPFEEAFDTMNEFASKI